MPIRLDGGLKCPPLAPRDVEPLRKKGEKGCAQVNASTRLGNGGDLELLESVGGQQAVCFRGRMKNVPEKVFVGINSDLALRGQGHVGEAVGCRVVEQIQHDTVCIHAGDRRGGKERL